MTEEVSQTSTADLMQPILRSATANDARWYIEHVGALAAESDAQIPLRTDEFFRSPDQQAEMFIGATARGDLFLIAEMNGIRIGELNLRRGSRAAFKHSAVLGISVAREWRNRRIGSALMQRAIHWAAGEGALRRIELNVFATNAAAIRLYQRFGFVIEGRRKDAVGVGNGFVDDFVMAYIAKCSTSTPGPTR
jgi:RimJ/RimL family protein N-acetyltransferase